MSALTLTVDGQRTTVATADRVIGYIIDSGFGYHIVDVRPVDGRAVPITADSFAEGLALFESLALLPAGEECFSGFVETRQVTCSAWVNEGTPAVAALSFHHFGKPESPEFGIDLNLNADEIRQLVSVLNFMLARLAVVS